MFSQEARSIQYGLGTLAGKVGSAEWEIIRQAQANLAALAEGLEEFETKTSLVHMQPAHTGGSDE